MGGMWTVPILQAHDEDVAPDASEMADKDAADIQAFDHEVVKTPQPYFPADENKKK